MADSENTQAQAQDVPKRRGRKPKSAEAQDVPTQADTAATSEPAEAAPAIPTRDGFVNWRKPSGFIIETNDMPETVEYCASLGWERL